MNDTALFLAFAGETFTLINADVISDGESSISIDKEMIKQCSDMLGKLDSGIDILSRWEKYGEALGVAYGDGSGEFVGSADASGNADGDGSGSADGETLGLGFTLLDITFTTTTAVTPLPSFADTVAGTFGDVSACGAGEGWKLFAS